MYLNIHKNSQSGVAFIEYAILLAFIVSVGIALEIQVKDEAAKVEMAMAILDYDPSLIGGGTDQTLTVFQNLCETDADFFAENQDLCQEYNFYLRQGRRACQPGQTTNCYVEEDTN